MMVTSARVSQIESTLKTIKTISYIFLLCYLFLREEVYVLDSSDKDIIELVRNTLLQLAMQKHHFTI